ncbi:MAG: dephospho-CoA kinase [Propionibacteriaceae bacterium]|jgi:dephospho-CoA kinase|uniref:Dephospho-CoA kinase n=1 Tax=Brooklawnia propionicigenes TaxID=3041175 RepID=A0AAN0MFI0_9ACTN|nr:dephospho-CoA kinase [Brooklawnia sp. SH051]MCB0884818.1 dephospho-CoA kinase [Propionibacteriaceae bacterium]BEH01211.1 dephospho-CoA kinase [Brooklawnia sp. SH051]
MSVLSVALTGGIGAGKTTVARLLAQRGAILIDSDVLSREVVEPGTPGLEAIVERFGPAVLAADGSLDRQALGTIIFADAQARADLNGIVHPEVRRRRAELIASAPDGSIVISVIPLLVEGGLQDGFDGVIVVDVPIDTQVDRLKARSDLDDQQARARVNAQASRDERLEVADWVIENSGSYDQLRQQVEVVWDALNKKVRSL